MSSLLEPVLKLGPTTGVLGRRITTVDGLLETEGLNLGWINLTSVPEAIAQLTQLNVLYLHRNQLSSLPESIRHLKNLMELDVSINQLSSLPEWVGTLINPTKLDICGNPITELPESITRLQKLKCAQIECRGKITIERAPVGITALPCYTNTIRPKIIYGMTMSYSEALKKLKLYKYDNENLTDISSLIGKWECCDRINISNNRISTLPDQLSTLTELRDFNIANNMFDSFPGVLLKMTWLTSLNISGNSFTELPEGITTLSKLANLKIKDYHGKVTVQYAPVNISTLPCYNLNADLKKLNPSIQLPAELKRYILPMAPTFNTSENNRLGKGGQATVYKGAIQGKQVAVKVVQPDAETIKYAADEVILTKKIPHQNIINIMGVHLSLAGMWIVMELASDSLKGMIDKKKGPLAPFDIVTFGKQIADALNYCVTQNPKEPIHHCDLKTENVLIVNGQAKLADFGLAHTRQRTGFSTRFSRTKDGRGEVAGTIHWQGPEIHSKVCKSNLKEDSTGHRGELSDVYAFGMLLWSMATGQYPFLGRTNPEITSCLSNGERPELPADIHPTLAHLICSCWRQNYKLRPRFSKVVAVLSMCGAGNLDVASNEILNQLLPIRYSPTDEMFSGELYQYLTEQGVSQSVALELRNRQTNGDYFSIYSARKFVDTFKITVTDAQHLVSLQTLVPTLQNQESTPQVPSPPTSPFTVKKPASVVKSEPSTPDAKPQVSQPSTCRPIPPKPIIEMDTDELVTYLRGQKGILDSFLNGLLQEEVTGEFFLKEVDEQMLTGVPFNL